MNKRRFLLSVCIWVVGLSVMGFAAYPSAAPVTNQTDFTVSIIVVDTFGDTLPAAELSEDEETCVISAEEQGYVIRGVSAEDTLDAHGDLVTAQIEETLAELGMEDVEIIQMPMSLDADTLVADIQTAIDDSDSDFFVLNMSFALIPCEFLEAMQAFGGEFLGANQAGNLNQYRGIFQRAVTFYDGQVFPANSQRFQNNAELHPLQTLLEANPNVIAIASAGNFGLDYPFWPAAFGQIVSVSASTGEGLDAPMAWVKNGRDKDMPLLMAGEGNQAFRISNYGEVMMPGEYAVDEEGTITVTGTSFAAPRLSALTAVYLANVGDGFCKNDEGYFALASGEFDNLTLEEAISASCTDLAAYLPE